MWWLTCRSLPHLCAEQSQIFPMAPLCHELFVFPLTPILEMLGISVHHTERVIVGCVGVGGCVLPCLLKCAQLQPTDWLFSKHRITGRSSSCPTSSRNVTEADRKVNQLVENWTLERVQKTLLDAKMRYDATLRTDPVAHSSAATTRWSATGIEAKKAAQRAPPRVWGRNSERGRIADPPTSRADNAARRTAAH